MSQVCTLTDLKFSGLRPASDTRPEAKFSVQDPAQPHTGSGTSQAEATSLRQDNYDKLASDKPGEELAPDSSIWKLYAEEAKEHDADLVADRNRNLDTMLLFAGLFSAILTAFLIESTNMLRPDLAETSAALLLYLAQSQWRIETGNRDKSLPLVEIPSFKPSASARWINTLWFMALALSLAAAMMAMLAKEWLSAFTASTPRHPHEYALQRQARFDALVSWNALRIIDFLPTLLHFSLLMFTLGLIVQLWLLDRVIAMIVAAASATLTLSYLGVVILGAATDTCPYRTRVSRYIKKIFDYWKDKPSGRGSNQTASQPGPHNNAKADDLRALQWLSSNARDPTVGDNAYQALSGLRSRKIRKWQLEFESPGQVDANSQQIMEDHHAVLKMGTEVLDRLLESLSRYPRELAFCRGINAARYAGALPEIYSYACECLRPLKQSDGGGDDFPGRLTKLKQDLEMNARAFKERAFQALDAVWNDECPPFTADAYARLTAAELRLIGSALGEIHAQSSTRNNIHSHELEKSIFSAHTSIDLAPNLPSSTEKEPDVMLDKLRARYSRALCRSAFQLRFHSNGRAPIGNFSLINLLEAICELAIQNGLDSDKTLSTHYQRDDMGEPVPIIAFITGTSGYRILDPNDIGDEDGLLAGLTVLLGSTAAKSLPRLEIAAANAMAAIGPKLITQWVTVQHVSTDNGYKPPERWPSLSMPDSPKSVAQDREVNMPRTKCVITQLLETTHFAISHFNHPGICELPDIALESLYNRASTPVSARHTAHEVIAPQISLLKDWIDSVGRVETQNQRENSNAWSQTAKVYLLRLLAIRSKEKKTIFDHLLKQMPGTEHGAENRRLFIILEIMGTASGYTEDIIKLLDNVASSVHTNYDGNYSKSFTTMSDGFHYLQKIGSHPDYAEHVAQTIMHIVTYLVHESGDGMGWIQASAIPGFLDAVSFVCRHPPPQWNKSSNSFIPAVIETLQHLDLRLITPYLSVQGALDDLRAASKYMSNRMFKARSLSAQTKMEADVQRVATLVESLSKGVRERHQKIPVHIVTTGTDIEQ